MDDGDFKCQQCSRTYKQKHNLVRHLRYECGVQRFSCAVCPYRATRRNILRAHMFKAHNMIISDILCQSLFDLDS